MHKNGTSRHATFLYTCAFDAVVVNDAELLLDMGSPPVTSFYFFTSKSAHIVKKASGETLAKTQRGNYKLHKNTAPHLIEL
jgi:hypothetical protein